MATTGMLARHLESTTLYLPHSPHRHHLVHLPTVLRSSLSGTSESLCCVVVRNAERDFGPASYNVDVEIAFYSTNVAGLPELKTRLFVSATNQPHLGR